MTRDDAAPGTRVTDTHELELQGTVVADDQVLPLRDGYVYVQWDHWEDGHLSVTPLYELRPAAETQ